MISGQDREARSLVRRFEAPGRPTSEEEPPNLMPTSRSGALDAARKLLRGFASAPDPRRHAQALYSELTHAEGWSAAEEQAILSLGAWLQARPNLGDLKLRCEKTLAELHPRR
jgi:hypothetical protein